MTIVENTAVKSTNKMLIKEKKTKVKKKHAKSIDQPPLAYNN